MGSNFTLREASALYIEFIRLHYRNVEDFADWHNLTMVEARDFLFVAQAAYEVGY